MKSNILNTFAITAVWGILPSIVMYLSIYSRENVSCLFHYLLHWRFSCTWLQCTLIVVFTRTVRNPHIDFHSRHVSTQKYWLILDWSVSGIHSFHMSEVFAYILRDCIQVYVISTTYMDSIWEILKALKSLMLFLVPVQQCSASNLWQDIKIVSILPCQ